MLKNLAAVGLGNVAHANSHCRTQPAAGRERAGLSWHHVVTMMHKFRDMPANLNLRRNIFVLIDEAHRTTGGDSWQLSDGGPATMQVSLVLRAPRWTRRSTERERLRPSGARTTRATCTSIPSPRASRTERRCRSTTILRLTRCSCRTRSWKRSSCRWPRQKASRTSRN